MLRSNFSIVGALLVQIPFPAFALDQRETAAQLKSKFCQQVGVPRL
jgi:hypothetical protein